MKLTSPALDLAYCTNIHPAETWGETLHALEMHTLQVKANLVAHGVISESEPYAIGLRLSACAASELLREHMDSFRRWLEKHNCYVFTINGFPYGAFHGTLVKERVYQPDWASEDRLNYTRDLFTILAKIARPGSSASVSTLPGSFKEFNSNVHEIAKKLRLLAKEIDDLSEACNIDFHLGLEPEPLGLFENTSETLLFFDKLLDERETQEMCKRRIGINYDTCHFAIEYEDPLKSIESFQNEGLRISKIHASNALSLNPQDSVARDAIKAFEEPTYLHQVIARHADQSLMRFRDLPDLFSSAGYAEACKAEEWRVHFHIPLFSEPRLPLRSTKHHLQEICRLARCGTLQCPHWEFETYTWGVLPDDLQAPVVDQLCEEYHWLLKHLCGDSE